MENKCMKCGQETIHPTPDELPEGTIICIDCWGKRNWPGEVDRSEDAKLWEADRY